jgi:hypothetical protein
MVGDLVKNWPNDTLACQGSAGMTTCIQSTAGTIGYIDSGHGHGAGLAEISLYNSAGTLQDSKMAAAKGGISSAESGVIPSEASADFGNVSFLNRPGEFTWPIVQMTYIYVKKNLTSIADPDEKTLLKAFLLALYTDDYVQKCVTDYDFTLPSPTLRQFALDAINTMIDAGGTSTQTPGVDWIFELATLPGTGASDYVISAKRSSIDTIVSDLNAADIRDLQTQVQRIDALQQELASSSSSSNNGDFSDQDSQHLTASLVLSSLSFTFWMLFGLYQMVKFVKKP